MALAPECAAEEAALGLVAVEIEEIGERVVRKVEALEYLKGVVFESVTSDQL